MDAMRLTEERAGSEKLPRGIEIDSERSEGDTVGSVEQLCYEGCGWDGSLCFLTSHLAV